MTTRALASTFYASAHIYGACVYIYIYIYVRCSMCLSLLSLRFTNGGFAQHVLVGDFPRTAHRVEVSF
jgi:hypothetical protein